MNKKYSVLILINFLFVLSLYGQENQSDEPLDLYSMTLEELLGVEVMSGNISGIQVKKSPVAITTITQQQIRMSTARNLSTLLEIYVPGLVLMTHSEGDKIGIRGNIAAENYKLLLLINGRNVTNTVYEGVITEIDMWDMNDIEKVEVIRGPGSVTYGSGALAGVINIITKKRLANNKRLSVEVDNLPIYRSYGGSMQLSKSIKDMDLYVFAGLRRSQGIADPRYYVMNGDLTSNNRYVGQRTGDKTDPQEYLADGLDRPQIKVHTGIKYKNFDLWTRYTQSGQAHHIRSKTGVFDANGNLIDQFNRRHVSLRSFALFPTYNLALSESTQLKFSGGFDTQEYIRHDATRTNYSWDHYNNIRDYAFSQARYTASSLINYKLDGKFKLTTGLEYNRTSILGPWGKGPDYLIVREDLYIINDSTTNVYYQDQESHFRKSRGVEQIGNGLHVNTYSFLLESTLRVSNKLELVLASRVDKPDISEVLFSPRIALISELNEKNILRLVGQRSLRMMPLRAQYLYNKFHRGSGSSTLKHESINSAEILFTRIQGKDKVFNANIYYNSIDAVGFTSRDLQLLGKQQQLGAEFEFLLNLNNTDISLNHAFLKLIDFNFNDELKDGSSRNNITFSDYFYHANINSGLPAPLVLSSHGNNLNNWVNNATRFILTHRMLDDRLSVHLNSRILWDYKGSLDEVGMYENAYDNYDVGSLSMEELALFDESRRMFQREKELLQQKGAFDTDFSLNASVSYEFPLDGLNALFTIYSSNLIGNKYRYYVSTGSSGRYPSRLQFVEEPTTLGFKLNVSY